MDRLARRPAGLWRRTQRPDGRGGRSHATSWRPRRRHHPQALVDKELANQACDELHIVKNMHERKAMMAERSDAFVALPGGIGTFEELFEVWTWRQLGYHDKPVGILNVDGYYDAMLQFLQSCVGNGFMGEWQMGLVENSSDTSALLQNLVQNAGSQLDTPPLRSVI